jgi:hypothetical protein
MASTLPAGGFDLFILNWNRKLHVGTENCRISTLQSLLLEAVVCRHTWEWIFEFQVRVWKNFENEDRPAVPHSVVYLYIKHWLMRVLQVVCQVIWLHNKFFTFVELRCSLLCLQNWSVLYTDVYSPCPYIILLLLTAFSYNIYSKQSHSLKFCNRNLVSVYLFLIFPCVLYILAILSLILPLFIKEYDTYNALVLWSWWLDCNGTDIAEMHHWLNQLYYALTLLQ